MSQPAIHHRTYLDPRTLAKVGGLELRAKQIVEGMLNGAHRSPFFGSSAEFAQHRQYATGDDIRRVDWRVFGRTDRVYIKQFEEETNLPVMLVVDASESMTFGSINVGDHLGQPRIWTKFDCATAVAATLSYLALKQQDAVGLAVFDQALARFLRPTNAATQWKQVIEELVPTRRVNKTDTGKVLDQVAVKIGKRSLVIVVSDFFDDLVSLERGLRHLRYRKHAVVAIQVLDPQEIEFPFEDVTLFKGMEASGQLLIEPKALRDAYLEQLGQFTDKFKHTCRTLGIDYWRFDSGKPLDAQLSAFLATRMAAI
jgi:uncharacterized protein (DUF58 family)